MEFLLFEQVSWDFCSLSLSPKRRPSVTPRRTSRLLTPSYGGLRRLRIPVGRLRVRRKPMRAVWSLPDQNSKHLSVESRRKGPRFQHRADVDCTANPSGKRNIAPGRVTSARLRSPGTVPCEPYRAKTTVDVRDASVGFFAVRPGARGGGRCEARRFLFIEKKTESDAHGRRCGDFVRRFRPSAAASRIRFAGRVRTGLVLGTDTRVVKRPYNSRG